MQRCQKSLNRGLLLPACYLQAFTASPSRQSAWHILVNKSYPSGLNREEPLRTGLTFYWAFGSKRGSTPRLFNLVDLIHKGNSAIIQGISSIPRRWKRGRKLEALNRYSPSTSNIMGNESRTLHMTVCHLLGPDDNAALCNSAINQESARKGTFMSIAEAADSFLPYTSFPYLQTGRH